MRGAGLGSPRYVRFVREAYVLMMLRGVSRPWSPARPVSVSAQGPSSSRPPRPPPRSLAPVVLVMGKGGVGKTTIAASLAVLEAETRGIAVLVEFGDGESGQARAAPERDPPRRRARGDQPGDAIRGARRRSSDWPMLAKLALGNFAMRPLIRAAPAIRELAMLESVRQVMAERPGARVVVDMPADRAQRRLAARAPAGPRFPGRGPLFEIVRSRSAASSSPLGGRRLSWSRCPSASCSRRPSSSARRSRETGLSVDRIVVNRMPAPFSREALADARALAAGGGPLAGRPPSSRRVLVARAAARAEGQGALEASSAARTTRLASAARARRPLGARRRALAARRGGRVSAPKREPLVVVCAGGGGVGKTTTSAALALALAPRGQGAR